MTNRPNIRRKPTRAVLKARNKARHILSKRSPQKAAARAAHAARVRLQSEIGDTAMRKQFDQLGARKHYALMRKLHVARGLVA